MMGLGNQTQDLQPKRQVLYQQSYIPVPGFFTLTEMYVENSLHLATELGIINNGTSNKLPSTYKMKKNHIYDSHIYKCFQFPTRKIP